MSILPLITILIIVNFYGNTFACRTLGPNTMEGCHFRIAVAENYSGTVIQRDPNGNIVGYSGILIELLQFVSHKLKFSYTIIPSRYILDPYPNGTWSGVYGLLIKKEVDFVFAGLPTSSQSFRFADFTAVFLEEPFGMLLPPPQEDSRISAIIKPFSLKVWIVFIISAVFVNFVIHRSASRILTFQSLVVRNLQLLSSQGGFEGPDFRSTPKRLVLAGWILAILVLVNCYTSIFISYATVPRYLQQVDTLEDLAYRSELLPVVAAGRLESIYLNPGNDAYKVLGQRLAKNPKAVLEDPSESVDRISTRCCVFLFPQFLLESYLYKDYKKTGQCRAILGKFPIKWTYFSIATQKGSPYTAVLSKEILMAKDLGLITYWMKENAVRKFECLEEGNLETRPIRIEDLSSPFGFFGVGIILGWAVFLCQKIGYKITKKI